MVVLGWWRFRVGEIPLHGCCGERFLTREVPLKAKARTLSRLGHTDRMALEKFNPFSPHQTSLRNHAVRSGPTQGQILSQSATYATRF